MGPCFELLCAPGKLCWHSRVVGHKRLDNDCSSELLQSQSSLEDRSLGSSTPGTIPSPFCLLGAICQYMRWQPVVTCLVLAPCPCLLVSTGRLAPVLRAPSPSCGGHFTPSILRRDVESRCWEAVVCTEGQLALQPLRLLLNGATISQTSSQLRFRTGLRTTGWVA